MRISDWSSDVCSSDLSRDAHRGGASSMGVSTSLDTNGERGAAKNERFVAVSYIVIPAKAGIQSARRLIPRWVPARSEEHTSELQSLMRISYAVFCLKKKKQNKKLQRIQ